VTRRFVAAAVVAIALTGCSGSSSPGSAPARKAAHITVFAASSLTNAFAAEAGLFAQATGDRTTFSFAGSQELVAQIQQGAPADVVATADLETMNKLPGAAAARVFAHNRLVIVTARGNPKHISGLADLARPGLVVILAAPTVPAGRYAAQALASASVHVKAKSLEDNVRAVLTKVQLGEADAGIVYATDARAAGSGVTSIPIPGAPVASYAALALHGVGDEFVAFLLSQPGQALLTQYGFLPA
jgi:molybdate transport system substrate-binding protein